jgi:hypothetical protein
VGDRGVVVAFEGGEVGYFEEEFVCKPVDMLISFLYESYRDRWVGGHD